MCAHRRTSPSAKKKKFFLFFILKNAAGKLDADPTVHLHIGEKVFDLNQVVKKGCYTLISPSSIPLLV